MSHALDARLLALVAAAEAPGSAEAAEAALDAVARELFALHYERSAPYRRLVDQRGAGPVAGWRSVPWVPIEGFREGLLSWVPPDAARLTFVSSGTTQAVRGVHRLDTEALYRRGAMARFAAALLPPGAPRRIASLVPDHPSSSLGTMVRWAIEALGGPGSGWVSPDAGRELAALTEPVLLVGTALGLLATLESAPELRLPEGSAIMETGGFKGQRTEVTRRDLFALYARAGVPASRVVGEYGMAELSSQWYDGVVGSADPDPDARVYFPAPWARTRVVDPVSLDDVGYGQEGLLLHFDPLNRGSMAAILTQDVGVRCAWDPNPIARGPARDGFRYVGRAVGAALKGCSTAELTG